MAKRQNQSTSASRRAPIPNIREQAHEVAVNYFLRCSQIDSVQNHDALGRSVTYLNAVNFKLNKKHKGSLRTPSGATEIFEIELTDTDLHTGYKPLASCVVRDQFFVLWSFNDSGVIRNVITLDDKILLSTDKLGYSEDYPVDIDTSNNSLGGEVFMTDFNIPPVYFMIKDMVDNAGVTEKYFSEFEISIHRLSTDTPINQIVFKDLYLTGGVNGLPTGSYAYSYRLVSSSGDTTAWSCPTPLVQVTDTPFSPFKSDIITGDNKGHKEYAERTSTGDLPSDVNISQCGVLLWLRVDNALGYNEVEISRTEYNTGAGLNTPGQTYIIQKIDISNRNNVFILEIRDDKRNQTSETLISLESESTVNSIIQKAKTIRYFNNKIQLGNIVYAPKDSSDLDIELIDKGEGKIFPLTHYNRRNTRYGMFDPEFRTYCKSLLDEESYGFAIIAWGSNMSKLNVIEPDDLKNIEMPHRDDPKSVFQTIASLNTSKPGNPIVNTHGSLTDFTLSNVDNFDEVIFENPEESEDPYAFSGETTGWDQSPIPSIQERTQNIATGTTGWRLYENGSSYTTYGTSSETPNVLGLRYTGPKDKNEKKFPKYSPMAEVTFSSSTSVLSKYREPFNKNPHIRSLCLGIAGVKRGSKEIKAISVVRTKPAGRVIAQGLCTYDLKQSNAADWKMRKSSDSIRFLSSDFWCMEESLLSVLASNPERFKLRVSRPQIFTTEVMGSGFNGESTGGHTIDAICHPYNNTNLPDGNVIPYTVDPTRNSFTGDTVLNQLKAYKNNLFPDSEGMTITEFKIETEEEGVKTYTIKLDTTDWLGFYEKEISDSSSPADQLKVLENIYIANIVDTQAEVSLSDVKEYYDASCFVKFESVLHRVGREDTIEALRIYSVDERLEDFHIHKDLDDWSKFSNGIEAVIYIRRGEQEFVLYNINKFNAYSDAFGYQDLLEDDIQNATTTMPSYFDIIKHGVYTTEEDESGNVYINLNTNWKSGVYNFEIQEGDEVVVKYNSNVPLKVFGDNYIGPCTEFQYNRGNYAGRPAKDFDYNVFLGSGVFPFRYFRMDKSKINMYRNFTATNFLNGFLSIRQLLWRFFCKTKSSSVITDGSTFPNIQYVPRPMPDLINEAWEPSTITNIQPGYEDVFPGEKERWRFGGFKPKELRFNIDYLKTNENYKYVSIRDNAPNTINRDWFSTRVVWSMTRPVQTYYAPGLKSFLPFNYKDIDDKNGQIVKIFEHKIGTGSSLMALTENALYVLMTNKRVLTGADNELVGVSLDEVNYIPQVVEVPSGSNYGLPLGFEGSFAMNGDTVCWANPKGVYMMKGGRVNQLHTNARSIVNDYISLARTDRFQFDSYLNEDTGEYFLSHKKNNESTRRIYIESENPDFSHSEPFFGFSEINFEVVEVGGLKMAKPVSVPSQLVMAIPQNLDWVNPEYPVYVEVEYINNSEQEGLIGIDHVNGSDDYGVEWHPLEYTGGSVKKIKFEIEEPPEGYFPIVGVVFSQEEGVEETVDFEGDFYIKSIRTFKEEERSVNNYGGLLFSIEEDTLGYVSLLTYSYLDILSSDYEYGLFFDEEKLIIERIDDNNLENHTKGISTASLETSIAQAGDTFYEKEFIDTQISVDFEKIFPLVYVTGETSSQYSGVDLRYRGGYFGKFKRDQGRRLHGTYLKLLIRFDALIDDTSGEQSKVILNGSLVHYKTIK